MRDQGRQDWKFANAQLRASWKACLYWPAESLPILPSLLCQFAHDEEQWGRIGSWSAAAHQCLDVTLFLNCLRFKRKHERKKICWHCWYDFPRSGSFPVPQKSTCFAPVATVSHLYSRILTNKSRQTCHRCLKQVGIQGIQFATLSRAGCLWHAHLQGRMGAELMPWVGLVGDIVLHHANEYYIKLHW